jgi:hypothetical protein
MIDYFTNPYSPPVLSTLLKWDEVNKLRSLGSVKRLLLPAYFWTFFCQIVKDIENPLMEESFKIDGFVISASENTINDLKNASENVSTKLHCSFIAKEPSRFKIIRVSDYFSLVAEHEEFHIQNALSKNLFFTIFLPAIKAMAEKLHCIYKCDSSKVELIWQDDAFYDYPILPLPLKPCVPFPYQNDRKFRDFKLICRDGEVDVHAVILYHAKGSFVAMMTACMREGTAKSVKFNDITLPTLKAFETFLYEGPSGVLKKECDPFELFHFASTHFIKDLVDAASNMIALKATVEEADKVLHFAETYHNQHLKTLYEHLKRIGDLKS